MGKLKKIGIGFGIIIGLFFVLIIIGQVWLASLTPEERQQWEAEREQEMLIREQEAKQDRQETEARILQEEIVKKRQEESKALVELANQKWVEQQKAEALIEEKLKALASLEEEVKLDTEDEVLDFIQNYKGKDNSGPTLFRTFELISAVSYPGENIFESPSTTVSLFAHRDFDKSDYNRYWKVEFEIQTYRETAYYEWIIDNETNLVYPGNDAGKEILDLLDITD